MLGVKFQLHNGSLLETSEVSNPVVKLDDIESLNIKDSMDSFSFTHVYDSLASLEEMASCND